MNYRLLFFLLALPILAQAQFPISPNARTESGLRTGQWTILYDSSFKHEVTNPDSAVYYRLLRFEDGKPVGKVRDFYRSGQKQWDGYMLSINPDVSDGECRYYHHNGKISAVVHNKSGKLEGDYKEYTVKGELYAEGQFDNDKSIGKWTFYFPSGKKQSESYRVQGLEQGFTIIWYESGQVALKGNMVADKREGIWEKYFENGKLQSRSNYLNGKYHGFSEDYYESGILKEKGQCKNGFYDGYWIHYRDNGKKEAEGKYIEGRKTGKWKDYDVNGILSADYEMLDGKMHGAYVSYFANGKINCKGSYTSGEQTGYWIFYLENGLTKSEGNYVGTDSLDGIWKHYHENGKLKYVGEYVNGWREGKWRYYYESGALETEQDRHEGEIHGIWIEYFENGKVSERTSYEHDAQHGVREAYYDNGQLKEKGKYDHETKIGEWLTYYEDGKLTERKSFTDSVLNGEYESRYANGNQKVIGQYDLGKKIGTWQHYYEDGKHSKIEKYDNGKFSWVSYYPNGVKSYVSQGIGTGSDNVEEGWKKEYYQNDQLAVEGLKRNGWSEGIYTFYDSISGKITTKGNYKQGRFDGEWRYYNAKGKIDSKVYFIDGFRESITNVRDSIDHLVELRDYTLATKKLEWYKAVLKRDASKGDINWATLYRLQADIQYGLEEYDKSLKFYQQYAEAVERNEGDSTGRYRLALNGIANSYSGLKQYQRALEINERLVELTIDMPSAHTTYVYNKALELYNLQHANDAEASLIECWKAYQVKYGEDHEYTLAALKYVARFQGEYLKKYPEALHAYQYIEKHLDAEHDDYLFALRKISTQYDNLDSSQQSIEWLEKTVEYQEKRQLDKYVSYFEDIIRLVETYNDEAKFTLAANTLLKGVNAITAHSSVETLEGAKLLSAACKVFGGLDFDKKQAIEYAEKAKSILEKLGKENTSLYETVLSQLAGAHFDDPLTYAKAEGYYKQLIDFSTRMYGKKADNYYTSVLLLANYYTNGFRLSKSDSLLSTISYIREEKSGTRMLAYYERMLGDLALFQFQYKDALAHYTHAGDYYKKSEGPLSRMYSRALVNQASTMGIWGKKPEAEVLTKEALGILEKRGEDKTPEYFDLQEKLADLYIDQLLYVEARDLYKIFVESVKDFFGEDNEKYRSALLKMGVLQVKMGEYKQAEQTLVMVEKQSNINPTGANEQNYFKALQELASLKALQKDIDGAATYYAKAKTAGEIYRDDIWYYRFLERYGKFCSSNSRYILAESIFLEALAIAKRVTGENHAFYTSVSSELAKVYQQLGKTADAEKMINVALAYSEKHKIDDEESYIATLETVAANMRKMGRLEDSEKLYEKILKSIAANGTNTNRYASVLIDMATVQLDLKKYRDAVQYLIPSLTIMKENLPEDHENILVAYNQLGLAYLELDKIDSAEYLFRQCVEKRKGNGNANTFAHFVALHNVGYALMRLDKFPEAEKFFNESFDVIVKYKIEINLQTQASVIDDYGMLYQAWGKPVLAEKYWNDALRKSLNYIRSNFSYLSDYEKAKFWERNKADFEYFNTFAVQRNATNPAITGEMYNYRLATKGILLSASNKLRKRIYASRDSALIHQFYQWTELREQAAKEYAIAGANEKSTRLDSLESHINSLEKELSISAEDNSAASEQLINWKKIQQVLAPDEAAIELIRFRYFDRKVSDSVIYAALVITKETKVSPTLIVLNNGDYLENKVYKYYRNCMLAKVDDELSYGSFWSPIESAIQGKNRIYISLDGVYNQISLKSLRLPDGSFLMDKHDFVTVSNTRDVVAIKSRKKLRLLETASLIGNPKFYVKGGSNQTRGEDDEDRSGITELPGTKVEIEAVRKLLQTKGWKVNALVQQEATEDRVKELPSSRVVHLATHGFFQDENKSSWATEDPMLRSGVLLTGAANFIQSNEATNQEDGILTAYEAANLSFEGTELVVLSACETARGEIKQGEGVYGLQRAFITAGAESLVMSLWKVDDVATQKLMALFYQNLMRGIEKSEALTLAQRELKKQYPHPFYWAAFVMMRG